MHDAEWRLRPGDADRVDLGEGLAWLEFDMDGRRVRCDAEAQDDRVDATILSRFASFLVRRKTGRRLTYPDPKGQNCVL